jgi:hypothetical protein
MEIYTDWKGNYIKPGQTLIFIRTKPIFSEQKMFIHNFSTGENKQVGETVIFKKNIWKIINEIDIWEDQNEVMFYTLKIKDNTVHIQLSEFLFTGNCIVCIKDVSDNEQDYYTQYFK